MEYKIITESKTDTGLFISDEPVFILSTLVSDEELMSKVILSLNSSKEEVVFPADKDAMIKWQVKQLSNLQEKTFLSLYKNSKSCLIRLKDKVLTIYPYEYGGARKGLIVDEENVKKFDFSNDQDLVLNFLKKM